MKAVALPLLACAALAALTSNAAAAADPARGQRLFVTRCASCHAVGPSARAGFGPQLNGVIGRRAGATPDFRYSPALIKSGIVWNDRTLAAFLSAPSDLVPGTKMRFWGIGDATQVADLLAYLRTIPPTPASR